MCVSLNYTTEGNTTTIIFKLQSVFLIIFSALRSSLACTGLQQDKTPNLKLKDPEESWTVLDKVWSPVHPHIFSLAICCVSVWDRNRQLCAYWWMFLWKRKKKKKKTRVEHRPQWTGCVFIHADMVCWSVCIFVLIPPQNMLFTW